MDKLTKAPRSPEEWAKELWTVLAFRDNSSTGGAIREIAAALRAAESRGRERGIEEAARLRALLESLKGEVHHWYANNRDPTQHMRNCPGCRLDRALSGNAAPKETPPATSVDTFTAVPTTIGVASQVPPALSADPSREEMTKALRAAYAEAERIVADCYRDSWLLRAPRYPDAYAVLSRAVEALLTSGASAAQPPKESVSAATALPEEPSLVGTLHEPCTRCGRTKGEHRELIGGGLECPPFPASVLCPKYEPHPWAIYADEYCVGSIYVDGRPRLCGRPRKDHKP